jgi:hypothetical protein
LPVSGITVASKGHKTSCFLDEIAQYGAVVYDRATALFVGLWSRLPGKMWII